MAVWQCGSVYNVYNRLGSAYNVFNRAVLTKCSWARQCLLSVIILAYARGAVCLLFVFWSTLVGQSVYCLFFGVRSWGASMCVVVSDYAHRSIHVCCCFGLRA